MRVNLEVLGEDVAGALGGEKVAFKVTPVDAAAAGTSVDATLSYESFAAAFGGSWALRLRLLRYPACALTTPEAAGCLDADEIVSVNDWEASTLSMSVRVDGAAVREPTSSAELSVASQAGVAGMSGSVFVLAAGAESDEGTFKASSLSPSSSWQVGLSSGGFSWSYPIPTVTSPHGATPAVAVSYSSQSVDGMTVATNNQPGAIGLGWDMSVGFVERRFKACARVGGAVADNCWVDDNATLTFGGQSAELVKVADLPDGASWVLETDPRWRVRSFIGGDGNNDDDRDERWQLTTPDGTVATFGKQWVDGFDHKSVLTVPVAAIGEGKPCSDAPDNMCDLGWRWMLDTVTDTDGNSQSYIWERESNWYGALDRPNAPREYHAAARLIHVEYGEDAHEEHGGLFTYNNVGVTFSYAPRCIDFSLTCAAPTSADGNRFPDVPTDLICGSVGPCDEDAPTFFTAYRLTNATSWTRVETSEGVVQRFADRARFVHDWTCVPEDPNQGGNVGVCAGSDQGLATRLWLREIQRHGSPSSLTDGGVEMSPVRFDGIFTGSNGWDGQPIGHQYTDDPRGTMAFPNRADAPPGSGLYPQFLYRVTQVRDELGSILKVVYGQPHGCLGQEPDFGPWVWVDNATNCYPQWTQNSEPGDDDQTNGAAGWTTYNKYVVVGVHQQDMTPGGGEIVTHYTYGNTGANWRRTDSRWAQKFSYGDWRGYTQVVVNVGPDGGQQTMTKHQFFRGMNGDPVPSGFPDAVDGKRTVNLEPDLPDELWLAGFERRTRALRGGLPMPFEGGTDETSTVRTPVATRVAGSDERPAHRVNVKEEQTWTNGAAADGTAEDSPLWVKTTNTYNNNPVVADPAVGGQLLESRQEGSDGLLRCTRSQYNANPDLWIMDTVAVQEIHVGECTGPVESQTWSYYDDHNDDAGWSVPPTYGSLTQQRVWIEGAETSNTTYTYDTHGRVKTTTDPKGATVETIYSPVNGPYETVTTLNPLGDSTVTFDLKRLMSASSSDVNDKVTTQTYDEFGRLQTVTLPGNSSGLVDRLFTYPQGPAELPPAMPDPFNPPEVPAFEVSTEVLHQVTPEVIRPKAVAYIDTFGRTRQTQTAGPAGVVVSGATDFDGRGLTERTYGDFSASGSVNDGIREPTDGSLRTVYAYDLLGRVEDTVVSVDNGGADQLTQTRYDGWTTRVDPPGTLSAATWTTNDSFGRVKTVEEFTAGGPTVSGYTHYDEYTVTDLPTRITDALGGETMIFYDRAGRQREVREPSAGTSHSDYDPAGNLTWTQSAVGKVVTYNYDVLSRKTDALAGDGIPLAHWTYDTITGAMGQLADTVRYDNGAEYRTSIGDYDAGYRPISQTWSIPEVEGALGGEYTYDYSYNLAGQRTSISHDAHGGLPAETVTTSYNAYGGERSLTSDAGGTLVADTVLDELARVSQRFLTGTAAGQVTRTYGYDGYQRLNRLTTSKPSEVLRDDVYSFNDSGTVRAVADLAPGVGQAECFTYDQRNRLTRGYTTTAYSHTSTTSPGGWSNENTTCGDANTAGPAPYDESYEYDAGTRMLERGSSTYAYDINHPYRLLSGNGVTYDYNPDGTALSRQSAANGSQSFHYDAEGRLDAITDASNCVFGYGCENGNVYDADGKRLINRRPDGSATLYVGPDEITTTGIVATHLGQWQGSALVLPLLPVPPYQTGPVDAPARQTLVATVAYRTGQVLDATPTLTLTDNRGGVWTQQATAMADDSLLGGPNLQIATFTRTTTAAETGLQLTATQSGVGVLLGLGTTLTIDWRIQLAAYQGGSVVGGVANSGSTATSGPTAAAVTTSMGAGGRVHGGIATSQFFFPTQGGSISPADGTATELFEQIATAPSAQTQVASTATSAWTLDPSTAGGNLLTSNKWVAVTVVFQPLVTASRTYTIGAAAVGVRNQTGYSITTGDHHGTGTTLINPDGSHTTRRYTPYGTERLTTGPWPNNHGFLNQPTDATGLSYLTNRYYDSLTATFTVVDPLVIQTRQPYIYAGANPVAFSDANGLCPTSGAAAAECHAGEYSRTEKHTAHDRFIAALWALWFRTLREARAHVQSFAGKPDTVGYDMYYEMTGFEPEVAAQDLAESSFVSRAASRFAGLSDLGNGIILRPEEAPAAHGPPVRDPSVRTQFGPSGWNPALVDDLSPEGHLVGYIALAYQYGANQARVGLYNAEWDPATPGHSMQDYDLGILGISAGSELRDSDRSVSQLIGQVSTATAGSWSDNAVAPAAIPPADVPGPGIGQYIPCLAASAIGLSEC